MLKELKTAILMLALLTLVTGIAYPLVVTGIAQLAFHDKANGSLIRHDGKVIGSMLIGQPFSDPKYFWSRPSATSPYPYNAAASSGSNQGPTNPALLSAITSRIDRLQLADAIHAASAPVDLVTASASGLDPHISPGAAEYQVGRVAAVRGLPVEKIRALVTQHRADRQFGMLGEARVNVLTLNLALNQLSAGRP